MGQCSVLGHMSWQQSWRQSVLVTVVTVGARAGILAAVEVVTIGAGAHALAAVVATVEVLGHMYWQQS